MPCAVQIDDDLTFFGNDKAYIYSQERGTFEPTTNSMPGSAYTASCGAAAGAYGGRMVVRAGGHYYDSVYILDVESGMWRDGPSLPIQLAWGRVVPTPTSFFILGGQTDGGDYDLRDTIFEFDPINIGWIMRNETMGERASSVFALEVERDRFCDAL